MADDTQGAGEAIPQGAQIGAPVPAQSATQLTTQGGEAIPQGAQIGAPSADEQASNTRQMLVSGLTGMPTPNMTANDRAQFEQGKAAGSVSVPVVAGATLGATAIPEAASALYKLAVKHLASEVLPELVTNAGESGAEVAYDTAHAKLLELAPKVWQAAKVLGGTSLGLGGLRELWKIAAANGK